MPVFDWLNLDYESALTHIVSRGSDGLTKKAKDPAPPPTWLDTATQAVSNPMVAGGLIGTGGGALLGALRNTASGKKKRFWQDVASGGLIGGGIGLGAGGIAHGLSSVNAPAPDPTAGKSPHEKAYMAYEQKMHDTTGANPADVKFITDREKTLGDGTINEGRLRQNAVWAAEKDRWLPQRLGEALWTGGEDVGWGIRGIGSVLPNTDANVGQGATVATLGGLGALTAAGHYMRNQAVNKQLLRDLIGGRLPAEFSPDAVHGSNPNADATLAQYQKEWTSGVGGGREGNWIHNWRGQRIGLRPLDPTKTDMRPTETDLAGRPITHGELDEWANTALNGNKEGLAYDTVRAKGQPPRQVLRLADELKGYQAQVETELANDPAFQAATPEARLRMIAPRARNLLMADLLRGTNATAAPGALAHTEGEAITHGHQLQQTLSSLRGATEAERRAAIDEFMKDPTQGFKFEPGGTAPVAKVKVNGPVTPGDLYFRDIKLEPHQVAAIGRGNPEYMKRLKSQQAPTAVRRALGGAAKIVGGGAVLLGIYEAAKEWGWSSRASRGAITSTNEYIDAINKANNP